MRLPQTASFQKFFATSLSSFLLVSPFAHGAVPAIDWGSPDHNGSDEHFSSDGSVLSATAIAADDTYFFDLGYFSGSFDPNVTEVEDWSSHWTIVDTEEYKITGGNGGEPRLVVLAARSISRIWVPQSQVSSSIFGYITVKT